MYVNKVETKQKIYNNKEQYILNLFIFVAPSTTSLYEYYLFFSYFFMAKSPFFLTSEMINSIVFLFFGVDLGITNDANLSMSLTFMIFINFPHHV